MKSLFYIIFIFLPFSGGAQILHAQVTAWINTINASSLLIPYEAGTDINSTVESGAGHSQLDVRNVKNTEQWKITVSKQDILWTPQFIPFVLRNNIGIPCGSCTGINTGTSFNGYLNITDVEQDFIYGSGNVSNIDLQFKIEGLSLTVDAQYYRTRIIFTLYSEN